MAPLAGAVPLHPGTASRGGQGPLRDRFAGAGLHLLDAEHLGFPDTENPNALRSPWGKVFVWLGKNVFTQKAVWFSCLENQTAFLIIIYR